MKTIRVLKEGSVYRVQTRAWFFPFWQWRGACFSLEELNARVKELRPRKQKPRYEIVHEE